MYADIADVALRKLAAIQTGMLTIFVERGPGVNSSGLSTCEAHCLAVIPRVMEQRHFGTGGSPS